MFFISLIVFLKLNSGESGQIGEGRVNRTIEHAKYQRTPQL